MFNYLKQQKLRFETRKGLRALSSEDFSKLNQVRKGFERKMDIFLAAQKAFADTGLEIGTPNDVQFQWRLEQFAQASREFREAWEEGCKYPVFANAFKDGGFKEALDEADRLCKEYRRSNA